MRQVGQLPRRIVCCFVYMCVCVCVCEILAVIRMAKNKVLRRNFSTKKRAAVRTL